MSPQLVTDPQDAVQLAAIAAELNVFMAERIVPRKRIGLVVEVRTPILAEPLFSAGPSAVGARHVPMEVLAALRAAWRDDNPRVGLEALYAFGALGDEPSGADRRELLRTSGPDVAALVGASDPAMRFAALRVIGRLFAQRKDDAVVDATRDGRGYWFVGADGGVFSFGAAAFLGSTGGLKLAKPVVSIRSTSTGRGYILAASDGGTFSFGDAPFFGSAASVKPPPIVDIKYDGFIANP